MTLPLGTVFTTPDFLALEDGTFAPVVWVQTIYREGQRLRIGNETFSDFRDALKRAGDISRFLRQKIESHLEALGGYEHVGGAPGKKMEVEG